MFRGTHPCSEPPLTVGGSTFPSAAKPAPPDFPWFRHCPVCLGDLCAQPQGGPGALGTLLSLFAPVGPLYSGAFTPSFTGSFRAGLRGASQETRVAPLRSDTHQTRQWSARAGLSAVCCLEEQLVQWSMPVILALRGEGVEP